MSIDQSLLEHAKTLGIATGYWDVSGTHYNIPHDTLDYFIDALDKPLVTSDAVSIHIIRANCAETLLLETVGTVGTYQLVDELDNIILNGDRLTDSTIDLPALTLGYYTLTYQHNQTVQHLRLIVAPDTTYQPTATQQRQLRGVNLQLYSLRSVTDDPLCVNWGIGDFADVYDAITLAGQRHLDFIGLNPLHALYPEKPQWCSPYSPSSRIYKHWIYLSINLIPECTNDPEHSAWLQTQQDELTRLQNSDLIDYASVSNLKMTALRRAFTYFNRHASSERQRDFTNFVARGGEGLRLNSAFYALAEETDSEAFGSCGFSQALRDSNSLAVQDFIAENPDRILFYSYLQWLIEQQLQMLQDHARQCGLSLGLYADLAVGSAAGSADAWVNPDLYSLPASIGAPPDPLGPVGQNWGLPPMHPVVLQQQGFQPFIDLLRTNMKHCGALRIDHVMGLYRLWCIPEGKDASHGAYIHYPFETLMAILAIESQRAQCLVIGEDLGTVPDEVRDILARYKVLSYDVLYFAGKRDEHHWRAPQAVNPNALGVVGTHDLPPLAGWWHCSDLNLLGELGIMTADALQPLYDARLANKQALLNALKADGYLPDNYDIDALKMAMHERLNQAIHAYAADGNTRLFGIQPENFCDVEWAFNVPGTTDEYPNWRRKLPKPLSEINWDF